MAASLNRVTLIGNVGKAPEVRTFPNGGKVVSFRLACSETWKDKTTGEAKDRTEWVTVSVYSDGLAKVAESYVSTGSRVYVEGKLETRKWQDQAGQDRYSTEVALRGFDGKLMLLSDRKPETGHTEHHPMHDDEIPF